MKIFNDIEEVCEGLNNKAKVTNFFVQDPSDIDDQANKFVAEFSSENRMKSHTISPSRWWFESKQHGMFEDGEIELYPLVNHAIEALHPADKHKEIKFVAINVEEAKISEDDD